MLKRLNIKSQIVFLVATIVSVIILLQAMLYAVLKYESNRALSSFFDSMTENTALQVEKLRRDVSEISFFLATNSTVQTMLFDDSPSVIMQNRQDAQRLLGEWITKTPGVVSIALVKDGVLSISEETVACYDEIRSTILDLPEIDGYNEVFMPSFTKDGETYFACVAPVFPLGPEYSTDTVADDYIVSIFNTEPISIASSPFLENDQVEMVICDTDDNILFSRDTVMHGKKFTSESKNNHLSKTVPINNSNWTVTVFLSDENRLYYSNLSQMFISFMIIITLTLLILLYKALNNTIVGRIELLKEEVRKISFKDTTYRVNYDNDDELGGIALMINRVLEHVHNLNEENLKTVNSLYQLQLLQKETRMFYLYSQVSPHFLYNSLSHIQGIAFRYKALEIVQMTSSLAKVFRYFSNNQSVSTIKQDLECAIEYFNVINMRREHTVVLENNVEQSLLNIRCLKMIFQPILENVLKHAFDVDESGAVIISSVPDEKLAIIEISDNGHGISEDVLNNLKKQMEESDISKIQNGEHIGLTNVNMRLKLCYNENCGIKIISQNCKGTTIRIIFEKEMNSTPLLTDKR